MVIGRRTSHSLVIVAASVLFAACSFVGTRATPNETTDPLASTASATPSAEPATPDPTTRSTETAQPTPTPTDAPTSSPDYMAQELLQARDALERWDDAAQNANPNAVVFTTELVRGGGWHGRHADDNKSAFLAGQIVAAAELSTEAPEPAEVVWEDGSTATVALFSAAEALDDLVRHMGGAALCEQCWTVEVVGARLTEGVRETSRGRATVPLWEFVLAPPNEPLEPVTYAAVKDRIDLPHLEGRYGMPMLYALGTPDSRDLTVAFVGSPGTGESWCGADYTATAVESEFGVVVLIRGEHHPPPDSTPPAACLAVGATRTAVARLAAPLGDRAVLDLGSGLPISVLTEPPSF